MTTTPIPRQQRIATSTRLSITLSEYVARQLSERAFAQGRSISNLAAYLIERALDEAP